MKIQNKKIIIENKIIKSIEPIRNAIEIINDGQRTKYQVSFILPTFTDSHCHVWGLGMKILGCDLSNCQSIRECIDLLQKKNFKRGQWLIGRGWNQELWRQSFPNKKDLDIHFPDIPVYLIRIDGHCAWVNSKALEIAQIDQNTNVAGGEIQLDDNSQPTGILLDNAMNLIEKIIPPFTKKQLSEFILKGIEEANKSGIYSFHDMDINAELHSTYIELDKQGKLNSHIYSFLAANNREYLDFDQFKYKGSNYKVQGIKLYADGALGSRGAYLTEKYSDSDTFGLELNTKEQMFSIAKEASELNLDIAIHAIGDAAVRNVIEVYSKLRKLGYTNNLRIEHSQLVQPIHIRKYKEYNIIASVQPIHCISDAIMCEKRLGVERSSKIGYPWQSFLNNEVLTIAGSDFPIESQSVIEGLQAFTERKPLNMIESWNPQEIISQHEALEAYIINPYLAINHPTQPIKPNSKANFLIIEGDYNYISSWKILNKY